MSDPPTLITRPYRLAYRHLGRARYGDLLDADLRLMLATSAYTPADTDEWADVPGAAEALGPGYDPAGQQLAGVAFDDDPVTGRAVLTCDPVVFTAAGFTCRWAIAYVYTGDYATSALLSLTDLGADIIGTGDDLPISFPAGLLRIGAVSP